MLLKPKSSTLNTRALLYKRFTSLESSSNTNKIFKTGHKTGEIYHWEYWGFDNTKIDFVHYVDRPIRNTVVEIVEDTKEFVYQNNYFNWDGTQWVKKSAPIHSTLVDLGFNNIAKYQMNRYYFSGSFDFMYKGSIEGTTVQYLKGNIIPLTAFNIKYFNDDINLSVDDLVVIDKQLYSVENPETVLKRSPKPFAIHYATLNSIL